MKTKIVLLLIFLTALPNLHGQQPQGFKYKYDKAGNRELREYTEIFIREGSQPETQVAIQEHILKVFPNPSDGLLELSITNLTKDSKARLEIRDLSGRMILEQDNLTETNKIDISEMTNGMYFMQVYIDDKSHLFKIIKEK